MPRNIITLSYIRVKVWNRVGWKEYAFISTVEFSKLFCKGYLYSAE